MQVRAYRVSLEGHHGTLLPPTSLTVGEGDLAIVHGEPGVGVTAFGLALAGRLKPSTGTVTVDGSDAGLPALVAVVDAPGVSDPDEAVSVRVVVGEELALAHRPAGKEDVTRWLTEHDAAPFAGTRFENLAALRTGCSPSWPRSARACASSCSTPPTGTRATSTAGPGWPASRPNAAWPWSC